jgi:hypothetical protein
LRRQALLDVFDTDQDGKLDADDANFSKLKLMVHLPRQQSISADFGAYTVNSSPAAAHNWGHGSRRAIQNRDPHKGFGKSLQSCGD